LTLPLPQEVVDQWPEDHRPDGDLSEITLSLDSGGVFAPLMIVGVLSESRRFYVDLDSLKGIVQEQVDGHTINVVDAYDLSTEADAALSKGMHEATVRDFEDRLTKAQALLEWIKEQDAPASLKDDLDIPEEHRAATA
jgi:hypothetical protein